MFMLSTPCHIVRYGNISIYKYKLLQNAAKNNSLQKQMNQDFVDAQLSFGHSLSTLLANLILA